MPRFNRVGGITCSQPEMKEPEHRVEQLFHEMDKSIVHFRDDPRLLLEYGLTVCKDGKN